MRILSIIGAFPENSIIIGRFEHFIKMPGYDYRIFCWDSNKKAWQFWANKFSKKERKKVVVSGLTKVRSLNAISEVVSVLWFLLTNFSAFRKHHLYFKGRGSKKYLAALFDDYKILMLKPEIIHFEFGTLAERKIYLKDILNCKAIVSFRGYDLNYYMLDEPEIYKEVWRKGDGFHFLGVDLLNRAVKRGYEKTGKFCLIPPAVDTAFFNSGSSKKDKSKFRILSTGRLTWKKGFEYGIRAIAELKKKNIPIEYIIIGSGDYLQALQFTAHELDLQNEVHFVGIKNAEEVREYLSTADVFLHPAISEGFCNAVIEAQAMGLPVVCTDADGLKENVADTITGFVVPKWDTATMSDKLEWCFRNPQKATEMGKAGTERVKANFKIEDQINSFEKFYTLVNES